MLKNDRTYFVWTPQDFKLWLADNFSTCMKGVKTTLGDINLMVYILKAQFQKCEFQNEEFFFEKFNGDDLLEKFHSGKNFGGPIRIYLLKASPNVRQQ